MNTRSFSCILAAYFVAVMAVAAPAQSTEFVFQGSLQSAGVPANGLHDFEFLLFDSLSGGTQIGATLIRNGVTVSNGLFSVSLDFGHQFPGADRFLEIRVRIAGKPGMTILSPRQSITSTPYSIRSLAAENAVNAANAAVAATANDALQLGGVPANQFVLTTDPRLSDARNPLPGNTNYIQNSTTQQAASNFNISGDGTAGGTISGNIVNSATQFNLNGNRVLSRPGTSNLVTGIGAGTSLTTGSFNSFFGDFAGAATTNGSSNSFFGNGAGVVNATGNSNSFFGRDAGNQSSTGSDNSFFGRSSGSQNTSGFANSFFGQQAGQSNTTGSSNSFFGHRAGIVNGDATSNSYFGREAGSGITGNSNSVFGAFAGNSSSGASFNAYFGMNAGRFNTSGEQNSFFGQAAGFGNTSGTSNTFVGRISGQTNTVGNANTTVGHASDVGSNDLTNATAIGANALVSQSNSLVLGSINGVNQAIANTRVGVGTTAPERILHLRGPGSQELMIESSDASGRKWTIQSSGDGGGGRFEIVDRTAVASRLAILDTGFTGIGTSSPDDRLHVNGIIRVATLGSAGATALCRNASNQISTCSSSIRYKSNVGSFTAGLEMISKLRPVSFNWINGGMPDVGFVAEEVAKVEPLLTTANANGEVEGVKYDRISVVLVNAVKEQQAEIDSLRQRSDIQRQLFRELAAAMARQKAEIESVRQQIDDIKAIKTLLCKELPENELCRPNPHP